MCAFIAMATWASGRAGKRCSHAATTCGYLGKVTDISSVGNGTVSSQILLCGVGVSGPQGSKIAVETFLTMKLSSLVKVLLKKCRASADLTPLKAFVVRC